MALSEEHLQQLGRLVEEHRRRAEQLRLAIGRMSREVELHERLIVLAGNGRAISILAGLAADLEEARAAAVDPRAYAAERGMALPDDLDIQVAVEEGRVVVRGVLHDDFHSAVFSWDSDPGFQARLTPRTFPDDAWLREPQADGASLQILPTSAG
jgi:plasmid replication initiation protein